MKRFNVVVALGLALPAFGTARESIEWDEPVMGGTACKATEIVLEGEQLRVNFDQYQARLRGGRLARATCLFSAGARWPAGFRIVIRNVALRGRYALQSAVSGVARAELFTTGGTGQIVEAQKASGAGKFSVTEAGTVYRSDCSGEGMLRMNSSVRVVASGGNAAGSMELRRLTADLSLESCE